MEWKVNADENKLPNESCGVCMISRRIVHGDWFKTEDNWVLKKVVFHFNIQVSHLLNDSFIQLVQYDSDELYVHYSF